MKDAKDALAALTSQALGDRTVREGARLCGIPDHQLRDVIYGHSQRPRPSILLAISRGLGVSYERLALAAYGVVTSQPEEADCDTAETLAV
jgi:hypothetical protein